MLEGRASQVSKSLINLRIELKKRHLREQDFEDNLSLLLFLEKEMTGPFHSSCPGKKRKYRWVLCACKVSKKNSYEAS